MKAEIYRLYPELDKAPDTAETLQTLTQAAIEAWHVINDRILRNLCDTMPHRVQAILRADGWYTDY